MNILWSRAKQFWNVSSQITSTVCNNTIFLTPIWSNSLARRFISPNSHPTYDPNRCRRGAVNEVYSAVSGPPVSSCFLCAYISWCFLLLLTFKDPAALSGLMERRRHRLSTHSPNHQSSDGTNSENSKKIYRNHEDDNNLAQGLHGSMWTKTRGFGSGGGGDTADMINEFTEIRGAN